MTLQKPILIELFAILLVLYGGFNAFEGRFWIMSFGLVLGIVGLLQGVVSNYRDLTGATLDP